MESKWIEGVHQTLLAHFTENLRSRSLGNGACIIQTPLSDHSGDPIKISVRDEGQKFVLDDGGAIAGHLFDLGQHPVATPAYRLLEAMAKAYSMEIDFDRGVVRASREREHLSDGFSDLLKVIVTLTSATPFIQVRPSRLRAGSSRLRTRIRKAYMERELFDFVDPSYELEGAAIDSWPIDFHWQVNRNGSGQAKDVFVVALDLRVNTPLQKAHQVASLSIDAKTLLLDSQFRVVIEKDAQNEQADTAVRFLRRHHSELRYELYDFGDSTERRHFLSQSAEEILGPAGQAWRELWSRSKPRTLSMPSVKNGKQA